MESFHIFLTEQLLLTTEDEGYKAFMKYFNLDPYLTVQSVPRELQTRYTPTLTAEFRAERIEAMKSIIMHVKDALVDIKINETERKNALCRVAEYLLQNLRLHLNELVLNTDNVITSIFRDVFGSIFGSTGTPEARKETYETKKFKDSLLPCRPSYDWGEILHRMERSLEFTLGGPFDLIFKKSYKDAFKKRIMAHLNQKVTHLLKEDSVEVAPTSESDKVPREVKIMNIINKIFSDYVYDFITKLYEVLSKLKIEIDVTLAGKYYVADIQFFRYYANIPPIGNQSIPIFRPDFPPYYTGEIIKQMKKKFREIYDKNPKQALSLKVYSHPDDVEKTMDKYTKIITDIEKEKQSIFEITKKKLTKSLMLEIDKRISSSKDDTDELHKEIEEMKHIILSIDPMAPSKTVEELEKRIKVLKNSIHENKTKIVSSKDLYDEKVDTLEKGGVSSKWVTSRLENCKKEKADLEMELARINEDNAFDEWSPEHDWFIAKRIEILTQYCHEGKEHDNLLLATRWMDRTPHEFRMLLDACHSHEESIMGFSKTITEIKKQQAEMRAQAKKSVQSSIVSEQPVAAPANPINVATPPRSSKKGVSVKSAAPSAAAPSAASAAPHSAVAASAPAAAVAAASAPAASASSSRKNKKSISAVDAGERKAAEERKAAAEKKAAEEMEEAYAIAKAEDETLKKRFDELKKAYKSHNTQLQGYVNSVKQMGNDIESGTAAQKRARETFDLMKQEGDEMLTIINHRSAIVTPDGNKLVQPHHLEESRKSVEKMLQELRQKYDSELKENDDFIAHQIKNSSKTSALGAIKGKSNDSPKLLVRSVVGARAQNFEPSEKLRVAVPPHDRRSLLRASSLAPSSESSQDKPFNIEAPAFRPIQGKVGFEDIFTCREVDMQEYARAAKEVSDDQLLQKLQSDANMSRYMIFNTHISRMFYAAGIIGPLLQERYKLVLVGKTALQLIAVFNHEAIAKLYRGTTAAPSDSAHSSMIYLHKPVSDCDFMVLSDQVSESQILQLKEIIKSTFSLFFQQEIVNYSEAQIPRDEWDKFRFTPGTMITKQSVGSENTLKYLKSFGGGKVVEIADFTFGKTFADFEIFMDIEPTVAPCPTSKAGCEPRARAADRSLVAAGPAQAASDRPVARPESVFTLAVADGLSFTVATDMRLLCEYLYIIIVEINKLVSGSRDLFKHDPSDNSRPEFYFKFMTTFIKFFSRIAQLACIQYAIQKHQMPEFELDNIIDKMIMVLFVKILHKTIKGQTKLKDISKAFKLIIKEFFIPESPPPNIWLLESVFIDISRYKETAPADFHARAQNPSVNRIVEILKTRHLFMEGKLPPPHMMGGIPVSKTKRMIHRKTKYRKVKTYKKSHRKAYNKNRKTYRKKQIKIYSRKGRK